MPDGLHMACVATMALLMGCAGHHAVPASSVATEALEPAPVPARRREYPSPLTPTGKWVAAAGYAIAQIGGGLSNNASAGR